MLWKDRRTDEQTKAISKIPYTLHGRGLKTNQKPLLLEMDQLKDINGLNIQIKLSSTKKCNLISVCSFYI